MYRNDRLVLALVANHLRFLRDEWDGSMTDESLTRSSNSLRILLVDGNYARAWRIAGFDGEPEVPAAAVGQGPGVVWSQAGGAEFGGVTVQGVTMWNYVMSPEDIKDRYERIKNGLPMEVLPLSKYVESTSITVSGQTIRRREVIKYVANKLGGDHIDTHDKPKEVAKFALLDDLMTSTILGDKRSPYHELLSIGQAVGRSPDANRLISRADELGAFI